MSPHVAMEFKCASLNALIVGRILEEHGGAIELRDAADKVPGQRGAWIRLRFTAEAIAVALKPLLQRIVTVSRLRRAGVLLGCLAFPLIVAVMMIFGMKVYAQWQRSQPER